MVPTSSRTTRSAAPSAAERSSRTKFLLAQLVATPHEAERQRIHNDIVELNIEVADAVAARYASRGVALEDLQQVARLALVRAVRRFSPDAGVDLLVYVTPCIRGEIRRHFRDSGWMVRPPRQLQEAEAEVNRVRPVLAQALGREPTVAELAGATSLAVALVDEATKLAGCFAPDSLDRPASRGDDAGPTMAEALLEPDESTFELSDTRTMLGPLVRALPRRERTVVYLRFVAGLSQREVGDYIGVTQTQVSRILGRILDDLRAELDPRLDRLAG